MTVDFDIELFLVAGVLLTGFFAILKRLFAYPKPTVVFHVAGSFFPVFLIVLLLRSFVVEPFRIPSGSMLPTLEIGDFILVNKFTYGLRLPVLHWEVLPLGEPERGDVVVFRYPHDPSQDYIKRLVGLPGDDIVYSDKVLTINGQVMQQDDKGVYEEPLSEVFPIALQRVHEQLGNAAHDILTVPANEFGAQPAPQRWTVPEGHYFVMGDNRDNSNDSRFWGAVPRDHFVGKAFIVWMNWDAAANTAEFSRIGQSIR